MNTNELPVDPRAVRAYLGLIVFHVAHILEEVLGNFVVLRKLGLGPFLAVNWALLCLPVAVFYFWLLGRRWAYRMSVLYAGFMVLNGFVHIVMTLATGRYFDGYAGGFSGLGLAVWGMLLLAFILRKEPGCRLN